MVEKVFHFVTQKKGAATSIKDLKRKEKNPQIRYVLWGRRFK
jgi:hypothetical protein